MTACTSPVPPADIFPTEQWQHIHQLLQPLQASQALWLSGYLAARATANDPAPSAAASATAQAITIAYGSETGNCEQLARQLQQKALAAGHAAQLIDLAELKVRQLRKLTTLWLITSTHGDGDPPLGASDFHRDLLATEKLELKNLEFAVLALGDSSYERFCQTGIDIDLALAALGARRISERLDCDVDYESSAQTWLQARLEELPEAGEQAAIAEVTSSPKAAGTTYSKQQPMHSEVLEQLCLSAASREHGNYHLSLALDEGSMPLEPGDAVGVLASNPASLVAAVLDCTALAADAEVQIAEQKLRLVDALSEQRDLAIPGKNLLLQWAQWSDNAALAALVEDNKALRNWLKQHHVLDLLQNYPAQVPDAQALVDALRPLQPRLYDVANYIDPEQDELHLLVKRFDYTLGNQVHPGIASHYLCNLGLGDSVRIYPHRNPRFALSPRTEPVILIGYGTGLAPYRAYLQARAARSDSNPCWLVLGEQYYEQDFLYQSEWQKWLESGALTHLDPVFADDLPRRELGCVFNEQEERLQQWLAEGAIIYLCGDKATLTRCEQRLQALHAKANGLCEASSAKEWKALVSGGRIKRNLY